MSKFIISCELWKQRVKADGNEKCLTFGKPEVSNDWDIKLDEITIPKKVT